MNDLLCPHCRNNVPRGATVCSGCQAEIEYGAPPIVFLISLVVSFAMGMETSRIVPESLSFLSWVVGVGIFVAGLVGAARIFRNRVIFKRIYRTK